MSPVAEGGRGVLLVTGASRGIGAATARLAAAKGHAVCVNYLRDEAGANALAADIERSGGRAVALQADVSDEAQVVRLFEGCDAHLGPLTGLVNNAGVFERSPSDWPRKLVRRESG